MGEGRKKVAAPLRDGDIGIERRAPVVYETSAIAENSSPDWMDACCARHPVLESNAVRCPGCGADNAADANRCQYCGSHFPSAKSTDRRAVFERIKRSPQYSQSHSAQRHARLPRPHAIQQVFLFGFFAIFVSGALFMFVMAVGMSGALGFVGFRVGGGGGAFALIPLVMSVVPLGMAAVGVWMFLAARKKMVDFEQAPIEATPAIIIDKRTEVTGGGDRSSQTRYYVTCEGEDGARREYLVWDGALYGRMTVQDAGVLYRRAEFALDFDRVE